MNLLPRTPGHGWCKSTWPRRAPSPDQMEQLALFEKTLAIEPGSSDALDGRQKILEERGLAQIEELQEQKRYAEALQVAQQIQSAVPEDPTWLGRVELLKKQVDLADLYQRALEALEEQDYETAVKLLVDVISREPSYEQATYYLDQAVKGKASKPSIAEPQRPKAGEPPTTGQEAADAAPAIEPGTGRGRFERFIPILSALIVVLLVPVGALWIYSVDPPASRHRSSNANRHSNSSSKPPRLLTGHTTNCRLDLGAPGG